LGKIHGEINFSKQKSFFKSSFKEDNDGKFKCGISGDPGD